MAADQKDPHFKHIFWFVVFITAVVFAYVFGVTFGHVPKENMRFVDIAFGFLLGTVLGGAIAYLLGGSPEKKPDAPNVFAKDGGIVLQTNDPSKNDPPQP